VEVKEQDHQGEEQINHVCIIRDTLIFEQGEEAGLALAG
jgi:hypothetical protein